VNDDWESNDTGDHMQDYDSSADEPPTIEFTNELLKVKSNKKEVEIKIVRKGDKQGPVTCTY